MITRFAPSPTGPLHLGHAYSALLAHDTAQAAGGTFHLRIEDTDSTRCRPEFEARICGDLTWLGCTWSSLRRQSDQKTDYIAVLDTLAQKDLIFPCDCNRRKITDTGAKIGPDGPIYPGFCGNKSISEAQPTDALRLNLTKALPLLPESINFVDTTGQITIPTADLCTSIGAPILRRKNTGDPAYHLACTHDDALQNVTHVIRGQDVASLTPIHVILQHLMGWPTPIYHHHPLITDDSGKRLAKISNSKSIAAYRSAGATLTDIRRMVGLPASSGQ